jgi:outer membrane protein assembly factor BamA
MIFETKPELRRGVPSGPMRSAAGAVHVDLQALATFGFLSFVVACAPISGSCQAAPRESSQSHFTRANLPNPPDPGTEIALAFEGLTVESIGFEGVPADRLDPLPSHLAQAEGAPLTAENIKRSLRQLYATGLYDTVEVEASRQAGGIALTFAGTPRIFIGTVGVDGAVGAAMNTQLQRASQLEAGTRFTQAKMIRAGSQMRTAL